MVNALQEDAVETAAVTAAVTTAAVQLVSPQPRSVASPLLGEPSLGYSNSVSRASSGAMFGWGAVSTPPPAVADGVSLSSPRPVPVAAAAADAHTSELMREMAVMKKLSHPNVVALHEVSKPPWHHGMTAGLAWLPGFTAYTAACNRQLLLTWLMHCMYHWCSRMHLWVPAML